MKRGCFITAEGNEGAGKSTIVKRAADYLASKGFDVITTREPGGIAIAEQIRAILLDRNHAGMDGRTEALLYAAARRQHYVEKIAPALQEGTTVLCDRFIDSSLAYQGYARGLGIDEILSINRFAIENAFPDLTLYLDVDPELGLRRVSRRGDREINRLDLESLDFHRKVRQGYLELMSRFPGRIVRIDGSGTEDEVFEEARQALDRFMARANSPG
jgi:dTMP kinase